MKYFSFATDFTYNRFDMREQFVDATMGGVPVGKVFFPTWFMKTGARVEGTMACWSFLFIGKYGFFPDSEVPFGRLQPYVGVGPGIMFSSLNGVKDFFGSDLGSASSVDIALVTEAGVRYMALKNVSLDAAFRYRWTSPKYSYTSPVTGLSSDVKFDADQFSALFRVSYHF
jgi:outer membrane protein W